tara:strand:- start:1612 stop:2019 length:408 start_codon:yes stop_codon:yes gene_type:complete
LNKFLTHYKSNKNIVYSCKYHIVWCTKYRRDIIKNNIENDLKNIIHNLANDLNVEIIEIETMPDHIHLLVDVDPQFGVHKFIKRVKGRSSRILRDKYEEIRKRIPTLWTNSYFVSSVGGTTLDVIKKYIEEQKNV